MATYWYTTCPLCDQGRLFITKILDTGELFLLCEECEAAWRSPEEIDVKTHFNFAGLNIKRANREDIESAGWFRYKPTQALPKLGR
jgi:hypothetical protein